MADKYLWILSYDVDGEDRTTAVRVCQLIFGRRNLTTSGGRPRVYDQAGFIHRPGVVWVGQSGLILPRKDAGELRERLEGIGVCVGLGNLTIDTPGIHMLRRRLPARGLSALR